MLPTQRNFWSLFSNDSFLQHIGFAEIQQNLSISIAVTITTYKFLPHDFHQLTAASHIPAEGHNDIFDLNRGIL